jgi:hypothetical protein
MNFTHWESKVAGRLGLSRDTMRALRAEHLVYLADWETISGRICLTEDAVGKIAAVLRLPPVAALPTVSTSETEKSAPSEATGTATRLLVWNAKMKNRRILEAYAAGTNPALRQNILRVRVKNADNFLRVGYDGKPMELPVVHVQADLYELVGPCPRKKGRW